MMNLNHLHNPTVPAAFATACAICQQELEPAQVWRCEVCPDFEVCSACYSKGIDHPHSLTSRRPSANDSLVLDQSQTVQLRQVLLHVTTCCTTQCQYPRCRIVKLLLNHGVSCKKTVCNLCKRMWHLFRMHARNCRDPQCRIPKCREFKAHLSRNQQRADSRRRAAVVRQRAADAATSPPESCPD